VAETLLPAHQNAIPKNVNPIHLLKFEHTITFAVTSQKVNERTKRLKA
jgi:hypothetical protein